MYIPEFVCRGHQQKREERKQMAFKVIIFVLALLAPIVIFAMAKSFCDWVDAQEKRKEEAAKWRR